MVEIGVIGGDGIGPEVVRAGMKVLEVAASDDPSLELSFTEFPWGCEYYLKHHGRSCKQRSHRCPG